MNQTVQSKTVVAADDDEAILDALQFLLEDAGYTVKTTCNGECIYHMENERPQLFLLDIYMSGQDGREICSYLKSQDRTKDIPVIMISANGDVAEEAKKAGANDFLAKPLMPMTYLRKLRNILINLSQIHPSCYNTIMIITKSEPYVKDEIEKLKETFEVYIKTVIDIKKKICSAGCDRHYESEELLLKSGSKQEDLWGGGIDIETKIIDFNSFINIRPTQNNTSNEIQREDIRKQYEELSRFFFKALYE